ncbi:MAG: 3-oxoacyl-[acyl-carrier-protein] synthase III C-terminal domain-containing protein [Desulfocapsaceae bacterium]|jgi:alkylresorcinol/alkylpyrone synthase|nr:3-oxoacyl-[acyl-carrier-protein] synthase III C-terminal domain-containing protein [Desulfocapsaceae bacterium]
MENIRIRGVGTAVPKHVYSQVDVRDVVNKVFCDGVDNLDRLLRVFDHLHIKQRHFVRELSWYLEKHTFAESNAVFVETAVHLSCKAALNAMNRAGVRPEEIGGIVVVSSTGLMTPSLDAFLIQELELPLTAVRLPLFGLGCSGGVAGLSRAAEISYSSGKPTLFIAVEISSVTFQCNDLSKANLVGTSIFADGAAALVIGEGNEGPEIAGSYHQLFADTYDIMGWDFTDSGMQVRFSRSIPAFVKTEIPAVLKAACRSWGISFSEITSFVTHPGGAKVLEAFSEVIGKPAESLAASYDVLRNYGNMSSATILFVLESMLAGNAMKSGYTLMSSLGPGFSSDQVLLKIS